MMSDLAYKVSIQHIEVLTHDAKRYVVDKPEGYAFQPGQATEVAINENGWKEEGRPFTFTNLPDDDHLEFTIKTYNDHEGMTDKLDSLKVGDELNIGESWGAINYQGPGWFIAGGAGVTPFIAIFKHLEKEGNLEGNHLLFSNRTSNDVILEAQWKEWLGNRFISILTKGDSSKRIDQNVLKKHINDFNQHFYVCGPDKMVVDISNHLKKLGASSKGIVFEE